MESYNHFAIKIRSKKKISLLCHMHDWQQLTTPYGDAAINMEMISVLTKVFAGETAASMQISKRAFESRKETICLHTHKRMTVNAV